MTDRAELNKHAAEVINELEIALKEHFPRRTVRWLPERQRVRLVVLKTWAERYQVSLHYVVDTLIIVFGRSVARQRKRGFGLPITVRALVSRGSEEVLQTCLREEFPGNQREDLWRQQAQERIVKQRINEEEGSEGLWRQMVDFDTMKEFREYYARRIERLRKREAEVRAEIYKSGRPYRGSPWR